MRDGNTGARQGEIRSLTGIRGLAACMVALFHMSSAKIGGVAIAHSYLSVDLFFVLSGFVMALTYGRLFAGEVTRAAYGKFMWRRFARVYPLYFLVTAGMAVLLLTCHVNLLGPVFPAADIVANFALVQSWGFGNSLGYDSWSISTELAAYVIFPWIFAAALKIPVPACLAVACLSVSILLWISLLPTTTVHPIGLATQAKRIGPLDIWDGATIWPLLRCLPEFMLGLLAWRLWKSDRAERLLTGPVVTAIVLLAAVGWMIRGSDVALVALFPLLIAALGHDRGRAAKLLGYGPIHTLGEWSYAIYLLHPVLLLLVAPMTASMTVHGVRHAWTISVFLLFAASLAAGGLAYRLFERPAQTLLRHAIIRLPVAIG